MQKIYRSLQLKHMNTKQIIQFPFSFLIISLLSLQIMNLKFLYIKCEYVANKLNL